MIQIIAVMFTFSFSSAFAALQYEGTTTEVKPIAEVTDFDDYDGLDATAKYYGTLGMSTIQQKSKVIGLENDKDDADGLYPADLQAKVDAAYDTAIAAVKAAKTNKEMVTAEKKKNDALELLDINNNTYDALHASYTNAKFTVDTGYYAIPEYGIIHVAGDENEQADLVLNAAGNKALCNWLMDQGYYGYNSDAAYATVLGGKTVKNAVLDLLDDCYVGYEKLEDVYDPDEDARAIDLTAYGRTVYAEYADAVGSYEDWEDKRTTTIEEYVAVIDKLAAFDNKYGFLPEYTTNPAADFTIATDSYKLLVAIDNWKIANLAAVESINKINTAAGYDTAKADIIATAKTLLGVIDAYGDGNGLDDYYGLGTAMTSPEMTAVSGALTVLMKDGTSDLNTAKDTFTENVPVGTTTATFDSSEANVKALADARALFDAYVNDYSFAYEAGLPGVPGIVNVGGLVDYECKLLAAEYNKANIAGVAEKADALDNAKYVALLNNATVKVTTVKEGKKVTVNAKVDAASMSALLGLNSDVTTVEYKFYHKAPNKAYKLTKTKTVNHITYTKSLKKGKNSFRVGVVLKDAKGNVLAEKSYKASTLGYRTIK